MTVRILQGDCRDVLKTLPDESVHCVVTSPPYWGLRDYGVLDQIGLEETPNEYIEKMVAVFAEVWRVLRADGTLWLNMGDSYAGSGRGGHVSDTSTLQGSIEHEQEARKARGSQLTPGLHAAAAAAGAIGRAWVPAPTGLKQKDLVGVPWMLAFALRAAGWYLRQDIIWAKPNPMPESVRDRCTKAHEYIFLLSKSERYYFDSAVMQERAVAVDIGAMDGGAQRLPDGSNANAGRNFRIPGNVNPAKGQAAYEAGDERHRTKAGLLAYSFKRRTATTPPPGQPTQHRDDREDIAYVGTRNKRSVWTIPTQPFKEAHFATFPPALIEPCILAGCPAGGVVLDPFGGAGTTGLVADRRGRNAILIELNPEYAAMAEKRIHSDAPLFAEVTA